MNKFLSSAILLMAFLVLFSACSKTDDHSAEREKVFLDDGSGGLSGKEVLIDDSPIKTAETQAAIEQNSYQEADKTEPDGTKISTMYDGYGNKTERRFFSRHPILEAMILRTASNGQKEILIFGHNGQVKTVPQNMFDKAMTATADELATAAGISEGRKPQAVPFPAFIEPKTETSLLSSPVSDASFNLQNTERENVKIESAENQASNNSKAKVNTQNEKSVQLEYQSEINKINLRAEKSRLAKKN